MLGFVIQDQCFEQRGDVAVFTLENDCIWDELQRFSGGHESPRPEESCIRQEPSTTYMLTNPNQEM